MGERSADNADLAVVELRKKARRRLVGAVVLALAAAVILPLLLEKEDKPLGDDVSVQIPPVDEGKFINRLTGRTGDKASTKPLPKSESALASKPEAKPETKAEAETKSEPPAAVATASAPPPPPAAAPVPELPKKSISEAEQRVLVPQAKAPMAQPPKTEAPVETSPAPAPSVAAIAPPPPTAAPPAVVPPDTATSAAPEKAVSGTPEKAAPMASRNDGFAVQIAAFTDDKGANALAAKLKRAGFASTYVEPVQTSRGTLWRVRVGGYPARAEADAARAKLKADGWNGIVVMAK